MLFCTLLPLRPRSTLFPYTTLFRSREDASAPVCCYRVGCHDCLLSSSGFTTGSQRLDETTVDGEVGARDVPGRSEEHTSELQSQFHLVCRLLLEKKNIQIDSQPHIV